MKLLRRFRWSLAIMLSFGLISLMLTVLQVPSLQASPALRNEPLILRGGAAPITSTRQTLACHHSGLAPDLAKQEFGWASSFLNPKYLRTTLCDDTLLSYATVVCLPATQLLQQIGWPVDLLKPPYAHQVTCTRAHPSATQPPTSSSSTTGFCLLNGLNPFGPVNICGIFGRVAQAFGGQLSQGVQAITHQTEALIDDIPAQATYQNPAVVAMWKTLVGAADILVGLVILWTGLRYLLSGTSAVEYASVIEMLPRLLLTLLVMHFSMTLAQFVIDLTNALCATVGHSLIPAVMIGSNSNLNFFAGFLSMLHALLALFLIFQAALELAAIIVAIPLGPLCLLCLFHPDTQRIARTWISTFGALCLMRFLQLLALDLGAEMLTAGVMNTMPYAETLNLVLGIGVLGVAVMIPGLLRQWILVPIGGTGRVIATTISTYLIIRSSI